MGTKRGAFIVLEGCDRAGKSTQVKLITEALQKNQIPVQSLAFPNRTTLTGQRINRYLRCMEHISDQDIHILFSENRKELANDMKIMIEGGTNLIVDRYSYSGVAFSTAKPNMSEDWCWRQEKGLPKPDLILFLELTPEKAAKRGGYGKEQYENFRFQQKVYNNYLKMMMQDNNWKVIDADTDMESISQEILKHVLHTISTIGDKPLATFQ